MSEERVNLDEQAKKIHYSKLQYMAQTGQMPLPYGVPRQPALFGQPQGQGQGQVQAQQMHQMPQAPTQQQHQQQHQQQQSSRGRFQHQQGGYQQNHNQDVIKQQFIYGKQRSRTRDFGKNRLYQITIYHILAHNTVTDLINDIESRCGNLAKLVINVDKKRRNDKHNELIVKVFFSQRDSAETCFAQYNQAVLDDRKLKTDKHY